MKRALLFLAVLPLAGCERHDLFPLEVGRSWTYSARTQLLRRIEDVQVTREIPVAGVNGYELGGPLGISELAWKDGVLVAQRTPAAMFDPPIPLLIEGESKAQRAWRGKLTAPGGTVPATATLVQEDAKLEIAGKSLPTTKTTLTIRWGENGKMELETWYQAGVGPIQQEQRTGDQLDVKLVAIGV